MHKKIKAFFSLIICILIYHILTITNIYNPYVLPPLKDIIFSLVELIKDKSLIINIFVSLKRVFFGFFISFLFASTFAILEYRCRKFIAYYTLVWHRRNFKINYYYFSFFFPNVS